MTLSKLLSIPAVAVLILLLYLTWEYDDSYSWYLIPAALSLVVIYIMQPQLDWWWYNRYPPRLDDPMRQLLSRYFPFYQQLLPKDRLRFEQRVALFPIAKEFIPKAMESVPDDVRTIIAANAVQLTFGQKDYLLSKFERIVIYRQPFPSPQYPQKRHASELYEEDGVLLFSIDQMLAGALNSQKNFNLALYEWSRVFIRSFPKKNYPVFDDFIWEKLEAISGFTEEFVKQYVGLDELETVAVAIVLYYTFPLNFKGQLPKAYEELKTVLNVDPIGNAVVLQ